MRWFPIAAAFSGLLAHVAAIDPIEAYGNKFFRKDGSQFFMKGVAYQLSPNDPLLDGEQCGRDAKLMQELGVNTIRVYHVDPDGNHDACLNTFADAGIYLLIDLDTFNTYILPDNLLWNQTQFNAYAKVMDTFHGYNNVLGFFIGNENIARKNDSPAAPLLKAAARDMKAYRDKKGYRKIPIGYSAADIKELRPMLQNYLTCGGNSSEIIDFFGLNSYSWCGQSNYEISTYNQLQDEAKGFPVPIFFTETGCIVPPNRLWDDQDAVFSEPMVNDWSGSIIYEWIQEENGYGIIQYPGSAADGTFARHGEPAPRNPDFDRLKAKWATLNPKGVSKSDYNTKTISTRPCPTSTQGGWWEVNGNVKLPTLGESIPRGGLQTMPSVTGDASKNASPTGSTDSGKASTQTASGTLGTSNKTSSQTDLNDSDGTDQDSGASERDQHILVAGMVTASMILSLAICL